MNFFGAFLFPTRGMVRMDSVVLRMGLIGAVGGTVGGTGIVGAPPVIGGCGP